MPVISIIIPCYNAAGYIEKTLDSVKNQTFRDFECIVVDDSSSDNTVDLINSAISGDDRFKVFVLNDNSGGPSSPRNFGISCATGRYVSFIDSDDFWELNKLEDQFQYMETNEIQFCCTSYHVADASGVVFSSYVPPFVNDYYGLLKSNTIGCSTVMIRRDLLKNLNFPNCGHEDFALWLDVLANGYKVYGMHSHLVTYRLVPNSLSSDKLKAASFVWNIFRKRQGFSILKSAYYFFFYIANALVKYK